MQRSPFRCFLLLTGVTLLCSYGCKKVIQVDLTNAAPRIVIEGEVTNHAGPYQVQITKTVDFSAGNTFPPVSGATVQVTDSSTGHTTAFLESSPGIYTTTLFTGVPLHTYNLLVIAEGQEYRATSTMPLPVQLDSVTFARNVDLNNKEGINAVVNFQDPMGMGNYYQFMEYRNSKQIPDIFVFEDRLSDGKYIEQPLFNDSTYLQIGDTVLVKMYCIDKKMYDYFNTLISVSGNNNGFQSASPTNPNTNISNGALGYFSAHTIERERLEVY